MVVWLVCSHLCPAWSCIMCHQTNLPPSPSQCPDEQCKKDLLAYLERIQLYCHQLKITSAVKADLNTSVRETVSDPSVRVDPNTSVRETVSGPNVRVDK